MEGDTCSLLLNQDMRLSILTWRTELVLPFLQSHLYRLTALPFRH